jgi:hypothetical protein
MDPMVSLAALISFSSVILTELEFYNMLNERNGCMPNRANTHTRKANI